MHMKSTSKQDKKISEMMKPIKESEDQDDTSSEDEKSKSQSQKKPKKQIRKSDPSAEVEQETSQKKFKYEMKDFGKPKSTTPLAQRLSQLGDKISNPFSAISQKIKEVEEKQKIAPKKRESEFAIPTLMPSSRASTSLLPKVDEPDIEIPVVQKTYLSPEDFFRQTLDPELLCFKCKKLFTNPVGCYKCGKVYCMDCLDFELNEHSRCIYCYDIIFKDIAEQTQQIVDQAYRENSAHCPYRGYKPFT